MPDLDIEIVPQEHPQLGRQKVHDPASRGFPMGVPVDRSTWRDKRVRVYDPLPNPNQCHGECTGTTESMLLNTVGNRLPGQVLRMDTAHKLYSFATGIDPWAGSWPPADTGSSGLAAAKAAIHHGLAVRYEWNFQGADGVVRSIMDGKAQSLGTWWYGDMFGPSGGAYDGLPIMRPTGGKVGGHQYLGRGYDVDKDLILFRTWWGGIRDFWMTRAHTDSLLRDGGDSHFTYRKLS